MRPADLADVVTVGQPVLSPDASTVAFVVQRVDVDANRYRSSIWTAAVDGSSAPRQVTAGDEGDGNPRWSPDGRWLAFTSTREKDDKGTTRSTLHLLPMDGPGEVLMLTDQPEPISNLRWSPDGTRLAFVCRKRGARYDDGDDDASRPPRRIELLMTRLDGEGFTVDRPARIWLVAVDGSGAAVPVTRDAPTGEFPAGDDSSPTWSPNSLQVAFAGHREQDWDLDLRTGVFLVEVGPGVPGEPPEVRTLCSGAMAYGALAWSPDGTRIAALTETTRISPANIEVSVVDVATGETTHPAAVLDRTKAPFPGARPPAWLGRDLLFGVEDRGATYVHRVPADGSKAPVAVVGRPDATVAEWDLSGTVVAATVTTVDRLPEVEVLDLDARPVGSPTTLTHLTDGFHRAHPAHRTERFTAVSPTGEELDAWLVRPHDLDEGERHPVLLSIHGGPHTQYGERWFDEFHLWAEAGFCVLFANPHGSTGREEAFTRSIRSPVAEERPGTGWGGIDHDDLLAVIDTAIDRYRFLDADRLGVLGGSYGGFMTSWMVGHDDRFKAACSERAANSLLSLETTSDVAGGFHWMLGAGLLDRPEELLRMSPVTYVRDIHTPLLILHSENDLRCHIEQADQLFVALRMLEPRRRVPPLPGRGP